MITRATFERLALGLPDASSAPHLDRTAFRVPRRIFATLAGDGSDANLRLDGALQEAVVAARPEAFAPVHGGWGRMGWTRCDLARVAPADLESALAAAHALASEPPPRAKKATTQGRARRR